MTAADVGGDSVVRANRDTDEKDGHHVLKGEQLQINWRLKPNGAELHSKIYRFKVQLTCLRLQRSGVTDLFKEDFLKCPELFR